MVSMFSLIQAHEHYSTATLPFVFLFYFFYDIAYTPMLIAYTLEILPFNIRAKGFAVMVSTEDHSCVADIQLRSQNMVVSLTLAFNQFVNPWALDALGWRYVSVLRSSFSDILILSIVSRLLRLARMRTSLRFHLHRRNTRYVRISRVPDINLLMVFQAALWKRPLQCLMVNNTGMISFNTVNRQQQ